MVEIQFIPERLPSVNFDVERSKVPSSGFVLEPIFTVTTSEPSLLNTPLRIVLSPKGNLSDLGWEAGAQLADVTLTENSRIPNTNTFTTTVYGLRIVINRKARSTTDININVSLQSQQYDPNQGIYVNEPVPGSGTITVKIIEESSSGGSQTFDLLSAKAIYPRTDSRTIQFSQNEENYTWSRPIPIIRGAPSSVYRINNFSISAFMRNQIKLVVSFNEEDQMQIINSAGVLWSPPLAAGPSNAISSPITKPQETTKFNIISKNEPVYVLPGQTIFIGCMTDSGVFGGYISLSYIISYEVIQF